MRTRLLPSLIVAAALAVAGCGGSSGRSSTSLSVVKSIASTASKRAPVRNVPGQAKFDAQLSSACRRANAAYARASTPEAKAVVIAHFLTVARSIKPPTDHFLQKGYIHYLHLIATEVRLQRHDKVGRLSHVASYQARPQAKRLGATGCLTG